MREWIAAREHDLRQEGGVYYYNHLPDVPPPRELGTEPVTYAQNDLPSEPAALVWLLLFVGAMIGSALTLGVWAVWAVVR